MPLPGEVALGPTDVPLPRGNLLWRATLRDLEWMDPIQPPRALHARNQRYFPRR